MMQQKQTEKESASLDMRSVLNILARRKWLVLGLPLVSAVLPVAFVLTVAPEWEAAAAIQVGQVVQLAQVGGASIVSSSPVEPAAKALVRLKQRSFQDAVLKSLGISSDESNSEAQLYRTSLRVSVVANTDLIDAKVRGYSPEAARRNLEETVKLLNSVHTALSEPTLKLVSDQLRQIELDLQRLEQEREAVQHRLPECKQIGAGQFQENALLSLKDDGIRGLRQRQALLRETLSPLKTYSTSTIEPIYVKDNPVYPKKALTVLLAAAAGLFIAISLALHLDGQSGART